MNRNEVKKELIEAVQWMYGFNKKEAIEYIQKYCNCDNATAKILFVDFKTDYDKIFSVPSNLSPQEQAYNNAVAQEWLNKPKCPTCQSTNVHKISGLESGASILTFGIFSKKINKTFKCGNCGMTF